MTIDWQSTPPPLAGEVLAYDQANGTWNIIDCENRIDDARRGRVWFNGDVYVGVTHWARLTRPAE